MFEDVETTIQSAESPEMVEISLRAIVRHILDDETLERIPLRDDGLHRVKAQGNPFSP